jgi:quercetin dioxygenase-like cupin family protein
VRVYETGESIIEGAGYPHEGINEGDTDVVLWVTYVIPDGKPLAETDLANCDG